MVLSDDKDSTPFGPQEVAVESLSSSSVSEATLVIYLVREEDVCSFWAIEEDGVDPFVDVGCSNYKGENVYGLARALSPLTPLDANT